MSAKRLPSRTLSSWTPRKAKSRKFLDTRPILKDGVPVDPRDTDKRFEEAFSLYDISPDLPELTRWIALATYLMGEHFKGCKMLGRQPGGSPRVPDQAYMDLANSYNGWSAAARGKQEAKADRYLRKQGNGIQLGHEKITKPRSLLKAVRRGNKLIEKLAP